MNWFNKNDIQIDKNKLITLNNINGYVLPHVEQNIQVICKSYIKI